MNMNTGPTFGNNNMAPPQQAGVGAPQMQQPVNNNPAQQTNTAPAFPTPPEGAQQFCLRWNSYPATVATQLAALRAQEDFVDVTLACDGRQLRAHKLVLSACSPYFMQLFKSTPCQHPVIIFRDVGFRQLVALLEFMYAGEVNVSQVELPALLRTAEALQVRGLADTTANNNNNNNSTAPQQPKSEFPPHYGQMLGQQQAPVQIPVDHGGNMPCTSNEIPNSQPQQTMCNNNNTPIVTSASSISAATSSMSNPNSKRNRNSVTKEKEEENDSQFDIMNSLDNSKGETYMNDGNNIPERLDDTGQIFPDDPMGFDLGDGDAEMVNDNGENQSEEESSEEVSDDDDGDCKDFPYQSDASYGQGEEGLNEIEGNPNGEVENAPGPSAHPPGGDPLGILPLKNDVGDGSLPPFLGGSGKNRLSRSLWPPGIPYHGPQQCPYCTRVLSNVGNWRKHVLTMHFAREKKYSCQHCTSAFRTQEYLQKHYVRVHNYPQKMTRRKYVEQT